MSEENPFGEISDIKEPEPVALHPNCRGKSFYDYSAEPYPDIDGVLLWCEKCSMQWIKK